MATAKETILATNLGKGCLGKAKADEPVFILRAQDLSASRIVDIWALYAEQSGCNHNKVAEARKIASDMRAWALSNPAKNPD